MTTREKPSSPSSELKQILQNVGPCLSSVLAQKLISRGISAVNARKIIQRRGPGVSALTAIKFPHNERFIYLKEQFKTERFWQALLRDLKKQRTIYGVALAALEAHGNAIESKRVHVISGAPLRLKKHLASDRIVQNLIDLGLLSRTSTGNQTYINLAPEMEQEVANPQEAKARTVAEQIAFAAIRDWARKLGLISFEAGKFRSETSDPQFGQFAWDFTAPSYIRPFTNFRSDKLLSGFLLADVILGNQLAPEHVEYFLRKTDTLYKLRLRPSIAMLVADGFDREALAAGKKRGLMFTTPTTLFGESVGIALRRLIDTLTNAAAVAKANPGRVNELFDKLARLESAADSLRGPLFEMIVAHAVSTDGGWVDIGQIITDPKTGQKAEVDVLQIKKSLITAIECRGHLSSTQISLDAVTRWVSSRIPRMRRYLIKKHENTKLRFELWTTGTLAPDAEAFLREKSGNQTKYTLAWKTGTEVLEHLRKIRATRLADVINEHYLRAPLANFSNTATLDKASITKGRIDKHALVPASTSEHATA